MAYERKIFPHTKPETVRPGKGKHIGEATVSLTQRARQDAYGFGGEMPLDPAVQAELDRQAGVRRAEAANYTAAILRDRQHLLAEASGPNGAVYEPSSRMAAQLSAASRHPRMQLPGEDIVNLKQVTASGGRVKPARIPVEVWPIWMGAETTGAIQDTAQTVTTFMGSHEVPGRLPIDHAAGYFVHRDEGSIWVIEGDKYGHNGGTSFKGDTFARPLTTQELLRGPVAAADYSDPANPETHDDLRALHGTSLSELHATAPELSPDEAASRWQNLIYGAQTNDGGAILRQSSFPAGVDPLIGPPAFPPAMPPLPHVPGTSAPVGP